MEEIMRSDHTAHAAQTRLEQLLAQYWMTTDPDNPDDPAEYGIDPYRELAALLGEPAARAIGTTFRQIHAGFEAGLWIQARM